MGSFFLGGWLLKLELTDCRGRVENRKIKYGQPCSCLRNSLPKPQDSDPTVAPENGSLHLTGNSTPSLHISPHSPHYLKALCVCVQILLYFT